MPRSYCYFTGLVLFSQPTWISQLAVLSDGNASSCITGSTFDPLAHHLKLFYPWPNVGWQSPFFPKYILKFKVVVEFGVMCALRSRVWYESWNYPDPKPTVFLYASTAVRELNSRSMFQGSFRPCVVYQTERDEPSMKKTCHFECTCMYTRCNSAYLLLTDSTSQVCEFIYVP